MEKVKKHACFILKWHEVLLFCEKKSIFSPATIQLDEEIKGPPVAL